DVDLAILDVDPQEHRGLAFVHPVLAPGLLLLVPLGQWPEFARIVEERLEASRPVGGLEPRDEGVERRHMPEYWHCRARQGTPDDRQRVPTWRCPEARAGDAAGRRCLPVPPRARRGNPGRREPRGGSRRPG